MSELGSFDSTTKIWWGPEYFSKFSPDSLGEQIFKTYEDFPEKIIQISDNNDIRLTCNEMRSRTIRITKNLEKMGFKQEDIIGLVAKNSPNLAPLAFAAFTSGMPINPLDISFDKGEIAHMFGITRPNIIFCDAENYKQVEMAVSELNLNCPIYTVSGEVEGVKSINDLLEETGSEEESVIPKLRQGNQQIAAIMCSSGTTGLPKGVCLTHSNLLHNLQFYEIFPNDIVLCFSSLYWLSGITSLLSMFFGSTAIITEDKFTPERMLRMIEQHKVTTIIAPPSQLAMILDCPDLEFRDLSSIRIFGVGGSMVPIVLIEKIQKYLKNGKISVAYGMSEVGGGVFTSSPYSRLGAVGMLRHGVKVKIIDDNGIAQGFNERGEILIKHRTPFIGYFKNPEATKQVLDSESWVHSGDIGYMDEDGFLFLIDRKKDILKYKNFHFFPSEIEQVILQHPAVAQCCVCGIPDLVATDLPAAAIIKKSNFDVNSKEIYDFVAERMSDFKHLRGGVHILESFPMTSSGKVLRRKVAEILTKLSVTK